jgi:hypothetical protein
VAVFSAKLLVAILIVAIFDQVGTATTPTCVRDFIDNHALIIFGIMQLEPLPFLKFASTSLQKPKSVLIQNSARYAAACFDRQEQTDIL